MLQLSLIQIIYEIDLYTGVNTVFVKSSQVTKVQRDRQLSTEMLNSTTMLLRMRDAVARLMEKCEKITKKMADVVEDLTHGDSLSELTEQPKIIPKQLKMTHYQMIGSVETSNSGLNHLVQWRSAGLDLTNKNSQIQLDPIFLINLKILNYHFFWINLKILDPIF